jgi:hypothetical protein
MKNKHGWLGKKALLQAANNAAGGPALEDVELNGIRSLFKGQMQHGAEDTVNPQISFGVCSATACMQSAPARLLHCGLHHLHLICAAAAQFSRC